MDDIRNWVEESPYSRFLGVRLEHVDEKGARLVLPYQDENSNPGKALHGGCAASLGAIGPGSGTGECDAASTGSPRARTSVAASAARS